MLDNFNDRFINLKEIKSGSYMLHIDDFAVVGNVYALQFFSLCIVKDDSFSYLIADSEFILTRIGIYR